MTTTKIKTEKGDRFSVAMRVPDAYSPQAIGVMPAGELVERFEIPHRDSKRKTGYQRQTSRARVNKLALDLQDARVDIPTAVLLNQREFDPTKHLSDGPGGSQIFSPNGEDLFVVDGQHRIAALAKLVEDNPERWAAYPVTFVCMLGADENEEMKQFYVVNSTAKSVRTDLAFELLKDRAEADPEFMASLIRSGEDWKVEAQGLTDELGTKRLWKGRIRLPSEPKAETTVNSSGVVTSLKPLLGTPYFKQISAENRLRILDAYWEGVSRILPEAFGLNGEGDETNEATQYAIQKSTGVLILHQLLIDVIEVARSQGRLLTDPTTYEELLRDSLLNLESENGIGEPAKGADFWISGKSGAAGTYSSNAGKRVLLARLRETLPEVEVE